MVESGGGHGNITMLKNGEVDFAAIVTSSAVAEAYQGIGTWEGDKRSELRCLFPEGGYIYLVAVRADSGVETMQDLDGKDFSLGITGSSAERFATVKFETLGIQPEPFIGGYDDAIAAIKDRRIVGTYKASSPTTLDASLIDLSTATPIRLISLTEEEATKILAHLPGAVAIHVAADTYEALPGHGAVIGLGGITTVITTSEFPEEMGYKIVKAFAENWETVIESMTSVLHEPVANFTSYMLADGQVLVPLHAGAVRYLEELGLDVPQALIPPEYK